tara:strand:- start:1455 stop:2264 length:810 start_codon:yes stop_codon:yes gene_type:complete
MSQPISQPVSSPVKKLPTSPITHSNPFDDEIILSVGIRKDFRGDFVPTVTPSIFPDGFTSFEIGAVCSLKSWVQGDRHASWITTVEERYSLNAVLGYYDDELSQAIPTIQEDGQCAIRLLETLEREVLKLAFVDHRVKCSHKAKYKNSDDYYEHAIKIFKGCRLIGDRNYQAIHMSSSTRPIMWKSGEDGSFVKDDMFQFDENPPRNSEPLNHLPLKSIVIPRVELVFHTTEHRYGVKLKLGRDIRVLRVGHVPKVYAANVYIGKKRKA